MISKTNMYVHTCVYSVVLDTYIGNFKKTINHTFTELIAKVI